MTSLRRRARPDDGSVALELVLYTPVLILLAMLLVALGRFPEARLHVDAAAQDAARAASLYRDPATARSAAEQAAAAALAADRLRCSAMTVTVNTSQFQAGGTVAVEVSCLTDPRPLRIPGFGAARRLVGRAVVPVDLRRRTTP